jgi:hypothetical protein
MHFGTKNTLKNNRNYILKQVMQSSYEQLYVTNYMKINYIKYYHQNPSRNPMYIECFDLKI